MTEKATSDRYRTRVPLKLLATWGAIFAGSVTVWWLHAMAMPEPEQTFFLNMLRSDLSFLAQLAVGGSIFTTAIWETSRYLLTEIDREEGSDHD